VSAPIQIILSFSRPGGRISLKQVQNHQEHGRADPSVGILHDFADTDFIIAQILTLGKSIFATFGSEFVLRKNEKGSRRLRLPLPENIVME
jgi:hypothetical protein